jgi:predicted lipoprotein
MKKTVKYSLGVLTVLIIIFLSLDIQKLDQYKAANTAVEFNAKAYVHDIWQNKLPEVIDDAPDITLLFNLLNTNPEKAFEDFGQKLGISKTYYFLAKGKGIVQSIEDEFINIQLEDSIIIQLATTFIFGNAVREGLGIVDISEFINMTDFNNVSVMLNKTVKDEVVSNLKKSAMPGIPLQFTGAFEINEVSINLNSIRIIPVSVTLSDGKQR